MIDSGITEEDAVVVRGAWTKDEILRADIERRYGFLVEQLRGSALLWRPLDMADARAVTIAAYFLGHEHGMDEVRRLATELFGAEE